MKGKWFRSRVTRVGWYPGGTAVDIVTIDYGMTDWLDSDDIMVLKRKWTRREPGVIPVAIEGDWKVSGNKLRDLLKGLVVVADLSKLELNVFVFDFSK